MLEAAVVQSAFDGYYEGLGFRALGFSVQGLSI